MKKLIAFALPLVLAAAGYGYWQRLGQPGGAFRTVSVKRGDLLVTISATGTVEPEEVIDVGAQVAGKIEYFGKDPASSNRVIDYGTAVNENTILAKIDDSLYIADLDQSIAQLEQAKANVLRAKADLLQMQAKRVQAEQNWVRAKEIGSSGALSATDYDSYKAAFETAKATVAVGEATIVQVEKAVMHDEASLKRTRTNLSYCTIRSPVKGVIIDRRVNIGQTVVASLSAPSLFLIAKDLKRMQVWASVNEADIGRIHPVQPVRFTVDAYPGRNFKGEVRKVRLNATMTQNVVTYTVEITTDNSDGKLLPYLTANVQFEVAQLHDVLLVPNAALRWKPTPDQIAPDAQQESSRPADRGRPASRPGRGGAAPSRTRGEVWVADGSFVHPVSVIVGLTDNLMTEIKGESVTEEMDIVIGDAVSGGAAAGTTNPFAPQIFRNRRPQQQPPR